MIVLVVYFEGHPVTLLQKRGYRTATDNSTA